MPRLPVRHRLFGSTRIVIRPAITAAPPAATAFIGRTVSGPSHAAVPCASFAAFQTTFGGVDAGSELARSVRAFFANGGRHCYVVRINAERAAEGAIRAEDYAGTAAASTGLHALDAIAGIGLLVIPRDDGAAEHVQAEVAVAASRYAAQRSALLLLDPPRSWQPDANLAVAAESLRSRVVAENVAVFLPSVIFAADDGYATGPAGAIAGLMSRLDAERGLWKAAAGLDAALEAGTRLTVPIGTRELETVGATSVNALRDVSGRTVVWGARTLAWRSAAEPAIGYVPFKRLGLHIEQSITHGLGWARHERNDEALWRTVRERVEQFLLSLWRRGALQGIKTSEAFFVRCDRSTMTESDIERGNLIVLVGFSAVKPAEFAVLRISVSTGTA